MYPNNNNFYMYKSNKNFCSGYFPDFITLNDPMYYQLSNNNNHNFYYLKTQNGKYLKYLSNKSSKYDNLYFNNMVDAYRISRIHSNRSLISNNPRILSNKKSSKTKINKYTSDNNNVQIPQAKTIYQQDSERGIHKVNQNNHYRSNNIIQTPQVSEKGNYKANYNINSYNCNKINSVKTINQRNPERGIPEVNHVKDAHASHNHKDSEIGIPEVMNQELRIQEFVQNIRT